MRRIEKWGLIGATAWLILVIPQPLVADAGEMDTAR